MAMFRGMFRCQRITDSGLPVRDPPGSGAGYRLRIHGLVIIATTGKVCGVNW